MPTTHAADELRHACEEFQTAGWDGHNAAPVAEGSVRHAVLFLESLPATLIAPTVGAEPDGQVTLEWYRSERHVLSVSVSPEGDLHYAAFVGRNRHYGTIAVGEPAETIVRMI